MSNKTKLTLTAIAARIDAHLQRFERDPVINAPKKIGESTLRDYWHPAAYRLGRFVYVRYISYQHTSALSRDEAVSYLEWLDAGNVGKHYHYRVRPT